MPKATTYAIFWEPPTLQNGSATSVPASYNGLLIRFFQDVGGHGLYNDLTQYYESSRFGHRYIQNSADLGGAVVDTSPYPAAGAECGQETNCVGQNQLRTEIRAVMTAHGWTAGMGHAFFIYTQPGEDTCDPSGCAFSAANGYCSSHYNTLVHDTQLIYTVMPFDIPSACGNFQNNRYLPSPNGDVYADDEISSTAHELMESVTDPLGTAWLDNAGNEIGDICEFSYLPLTWDADQANQQWNGHFYVIQDMFDDHTSSCVQLGP